MTKEALFKYISVFLLGALLGWAVVGLKKPPTQSFSSNSLREEDGQYKFIHPLLASYDSPQAQEPADSPLTKKVQSIIDQKIQQKEITQASVYFRDITHGRWMGINEDEPYEPASLLKVAIMLAYYKLAEAGNLDLNKKLVYKSQGLGAYETPSQLTENQSYTIEELITYLIVKSDNGAKDTLLQNIDENSLNSIYSSLGIQHPEDVETYTISAKTYALFFRILYNSTLVGRQYSEKALSLLDQAEFTSGLVAGVPPNTPLPHKFGEKINDDGQGHITSTELHDCGIVYSPTLNYVLCVMTKGQDKQDLEDTIKDISQAVYTETNKK